jgi:hypothetical protein
MICMNPGCLAFSNSVTSRQSVYEKLEKQSLWSFVGRPRKLLIRNSSSNSEILGLLCHVIVVNVELDLLQYPRITRGLNSCADH